jgi:hypothetical protein
VTTTRAPGTAAFVASVTNPRIAAVKDWLKSDAGINAAIAMHHEQLFFGIPNSLQPTLAAEVRGQPKKPAGADAPDAADCTNTEWRRATTGDERIPADGGSQRAIEDQPASHASVPSTREIPKDNNPDLWFTADG